MSGVTGVSGDWSEGSEGSEESEWSEGSEGTEGTERDTQSQTEREDNQSIVHRLLYISQSMCMSVGRHSAPPRGTTGIAQTATNSITRTVTRRC